MATLPSATMGNLDPKVLYMNLSDAQAITNNQGNVTSLIVYAQNPDLVSQVSTAITSAHPELIRQPACRGKA